MFATRYVFRNKRLIQLGSCYQVERVAFLHISSIRQRKIFEKRTNILGQFEGCISNSRFISTIVGTDTITVIAPGNNGAVNNVLGSANVADTKVASAVAVSDATVNSVASTADAAVKQVSDAKSLPPIPEPPTPVVEIIDPLAEPSFSSLGLGGWSPVGWVQNGFEFMHVNLDMPWWQCIVLATVIVRTIMFPVVIMTQKNAAKMSNNMPKFRELNEKINDAKQRGEVIEAAQYSQELLQFMTEKGISPIKNVIIPLAQAPLFISFFMGLREMANLPVKSLHTGGIFWFTDLTVPDQLYILPLLTSLTLWITIEVGADGKLTSSNAHLMRYVLRALPVIIFPFIMNFPGAILVYWASTNTYSLIQVGILRIPKVRDYLKIDKLVKIDKSKLAPQKPFIPAVKDWWKETRATSEIQKRGNVERTTFIQAGRGAIKKTYKYNPTLPRTPVAGVHTKKP